MSSKMEQIIEEIEEYIDGCKFQPLSNTKIIVNKEELEELIGELRAKTPEEIKRYQKIISNKEAILADAQAKADQIIAQAQVQTTELVSEHQMMQGATLAASLNRSRTRLAPTPTNISTKSEPEMEKKGTLASPATALASKVLPVPGEPTSRAPLGSLAPMAVYF